METQNNNLKHFEGSKWELFKLPMYDLTELAVAFANMEKRLREHCVKFPQDREALGIAVVDASSDYLNTDYKEGDNWIRIVIQTKKMLIYGDSDKKYEAKTSDNQEEINIKKPTPIINKHIEEAPVQTLTPEFIAQMEAKGVNRLFISMCQVNGLPVLLEDTNKTLRAKLEAIPRTPSPGVKPNISTGKIYNPAFTTPKYSPEQTVVTHGHNEEIWHPESQDKAKPGKYTSAQIQHEMDVFCTRSSEKTAAQAIDNMKAMTADFEILKDGNQTTSIAFILKDGTRVPNKYFFKVKLV